MTNRKLIPGKQCNLTYGLAPNLVDKGIEKHEDALIPVTLAERKSNMEAMILGVVAENSLPLSIVPKIKKLVTALALDTKAMGSLSTMDRTHCSYKLTHGLAKTFINKTIENLKTHFFSLNIDESGSTNHQKILTVLVSYYSEEDKKVVIEHLASISLVTVNSEILFNELVKIFKDYLLPWNNLCSILMDSCAVMRGSKAGLEKRIRTNTAKHLLDIDGDVCHHLHNATERFCTPFESHVENLFNNLYNHFKWSPDLRLLLEMICDELLVKFTMPDRFLRHRWLSIYDVTVGVWRLYDPYFVFFYACLSLEDKPIYEELLENIYERYCVDDDGQRRIKAIHRDISKKKLTKPGVKRKTDIVYSLIILEKKTKLIMRFITGALPMFKSYVCLFQSKTPLVHKLNDEQIKAFKAILNCFLKPELIDPMSTKELKRFDIDDKKYLQPLSQIHYGAHTKTLMRQLNRNDPLFNWFRSTALKAYKAASQYIQVKLPIDNKLLVALSAIDPILQKSQYSGKYLRTLPNEVTNILAPDEKEEYEIQVTNYMSDVSLPIYIPPELAQEDKSDSNNERHCSGVPKPKVIDRIDEWWHEVKKTGRYDSLSKMVFAVLSIFHGPLVESSFNSMGYIMDSKRYNMKMDTYNSYLTVQYYFRAHDTDSVQLFSRKDPKKDHIDRVLCNNIKTSHSEYIKKKKEEPKKPTLQSKKAAKEKLAKEEKDAARLDQGFFVVV